MKKLTKLFLALVVVLFVSGCGRSYDYTKLESELTTKSSAYYEEYIKGFVLGISQHKITLEALKTSGVDIENFDERECDLESYSLIKLTLDDEGVPADEYEVENHLTCKDYPVKK